MIFINMVNKKNTARLKIKDNELYTLPSNNEEMRTFVKKFKIDMMEHIISSIDYAIENKISIVELFQFKDSKFIVTLAEKEFQCNLEHINKYYTSAQIFELCPRVEKLIKIIQTKNDEKEKPKTDNERGNSNNSN